jgi:type IV pilus assembly protein PilQ
MNTPKHLIALLGLALTPLASKAQEAPAAPAESAPAAVAESVDAAAPAAETAAAATTADSGLTQLAADAAAPAAAVTPTVSNETKVKDTLSVDFPDEDIRSILRNVADLFELNLVMPDTLQGRSSIKLRDVTWRQIFKEVLTPVNYAFVEDGNIIRVVTKDSLNLEPAITEVFVLNYARAEEIQPAITPLVDTANGGRVQVDKRNNALIISERPTRLLAIVPVIEKLDIATEQVMIESKFIEVNATSERDVGLNWVAAGGLTVGGLENAVSNGKNAIAYGANPKGFQYSTAVLSNLELASTLRFLQNSGDSEIVSNPTVVTLNNSEAFINVGQEYPIPSYTYNSERGSFEVSGFEYKPIGIILKVTPQINAAGFIRLLVEPEISTSNATAQFGGTSTSPAAEIPIIESRKTKTQVSLKDGHTLGIGGLISEIDTNNETKLPFLGDIPKIGKIFKSKSKEKERRNLLIFITAKIVSAESAQANEIFDARQINDARVKKSDLPGFRPAEEGFVPEDAP